MKLFKKLLGGQEEEIPVPPQTRDQLAWRQGYSARESGKPISACPYRQTSTLRAPWERGWYFCDSLDTGKE